MLTLSRHTLRQFRGVLRAAGLLKPVRAGSPFVHLRSTADGLVLRSANTQVSIELRLPAADNTAEFAVPVEFLTRCGGSSDTPVELDLGVTGLAARWTERSVPLQHIFETLAVVDLPTSPALPTTQTRNSSGLLTALHDASRVVDRQSTRYALGCVQLRGDGGRIAATDSRQLLVQSDWAFPWSEDRLMEVSSVFGCRELPADEPVQIGEADGWIVVRIGPWTISHAVRREGRFPSLERIIPTAAAIASRMQLDPQDAEFLQFRLAHLPCEDRVNRPLTIDLNGAVALRAQQRGDLPATEVVLTRSRRVGRELRIVTNREFLQRALGLGFRDVGFTAEHGTCLCDDGRRQYVWMCLDDVQAIAPGAGMQRIATPAAATSVSDEPVPILPTPQPRFTAPLPVSRVSNATPRPPVTTAAVSSGDAVTVLVALQSQLRTMLSSVKDVTRQVRDQRRAARSRAATRRTALPTGVTSALSHFNS